MILPAPITPDDDALSARDGLAALLAGHDQLPSLFAKAAAAMGLFDRSGRLIAVNASALTLLQTSARDVLGRGYDAFLEEPAAVRTAFATVAAGEASGALVRLRRGRGPALDVAVRFSGAYVRDRLVGVYASIDESEQLRRRLRETGRSLDMARSLFDRHGDALLALAPSGRVTAANDAALRLTGYQREELVGRAYSSLLAPDVVTATTQAFERVADGEAVSRDSALVHRSGRRIEIAAMAVPTIVDGAIAGFYAIGHDVTERRRLENLLAEQNERIRELYLVAASTGETADAQIEAALDLGRKWLRCDLAYLTRVEGGTVTVIAATGDGARTHVGRWRPLPRSLNRYPVAAGAPYAIDDVLPDSAAAESGEDEPRIYGFIGTPIVVVGVAYGTVCFENVQPRERRFTLEDRDFVKLVGALAASALERGEQRKRLAALAFFDSLTGLPNRVLLDERLHVAIANAKRGGTPFALHFYDLDGFKTINDSYGHRQGDEILRLVAHRLERVAREQDTVARVGGDEFVVLQPATATQAEARSLAERLRAAVGEPFTIDGVLHRLSASGGIALFPSDGEDGETLLTRADAALYGVKAAGRDAVAFA